MTGPELRPRDLDPSGFTPALEALAKELPEADCVVFVDAEGETIDLATRVDPFEARVAGALTAIALESARVRFGRLGLGEVVELRASCPARTLLARNVGEGCDLAVVFRGPHLPARGASKSAATAVALRVEGGLRAPPACAVLRAVDLRVSRSGLHVPRAFDDNGQRRRVAAFLGVHEAPGHTCYLVRTDHGEELLIERDHATRHWRRM